jgi:hypothetical protein
MLPADTDCNRIQTFTPSGEYVMQLGEWGSGNSQFYYPYGIAVEGRNVYVTDPLNNGIQKFSGPDLSGKVSKIGVFRNSTRQWLLDYNGNGIWDGKLTDKKYTFGLSTDKPVSGKW